MVDLLRENRLASIFRHAKNFQTWIKMVKLIKQPNTKWWKIQDFQGVTGLLIDPIKNQPFMDREMYFFVPRDLGKFSYNS